MMADQLIGGRWESGDGPNLVSTSPIDGGSMWAGTEASTAQVDKAIVAGAEAFPAWAVNSQRQQIVERFAGLVAEQSTRLAALISSEVGKPLWDAQGEVNSIAGKATLSIAAHAERTGTVVNGAVTTSHRPLGVMVVLGPFNFPGHLANGHIMPALLAGNTVVFKPSEQAPAFGEAMVKLWEEAGAPAGVVNLVQGGQDVGQALVDHPQIDGVLFTGGVGAGRAIHRSLAGRPEVQLALELGGNNPLIVWEVDDVDAAARIVVRSAFVSSGQRCTCARRLITNDRALVERVVALAAQLRVGDPLGNPQPFLGPLISDQAANAVLTAQADLIELGGSALLGGAVAPDGPAYLTPAVIDMTTATERPDREIFGPLLQVVFADSLDGAIAEANRTEFGLAAGVVSDRRLVWDQTFPRLRAGIINWNRPTVGASGSAPFGGVGASGNHRPAGYAAADYCSFPVASLSSEIVVDEGPLHGVDPEQEPNE